MPPQRGTTTIERLGQSLLIRGSCESALDDLATKIHVAATHPERGFIAVPWPCPLVHTDTTREGPVLVTHAGLEPVATSLLHQAGHTVVVRPRSIRPLSPPKLSPVGSGPSDQALLDFVATRERGLIRLGPGVSPMRLVAQIRRGFPEATIVVAASRHDEVRRFGQSIKTLVPEAFWSNRDDVPVNPGPLVVSTYEGLGDYEIDLRQRDILICLDAGESLGKRNQIAFDTSERARVFGLAPLDHRFAPYDRDRIWCRYGFDVLEIPRHGCVVRPVAVTTSKIEEGGLADRPDGVELKRRGLWHHPIRNRLIVRAAKMLATNGPDEAAATDASPPQPSSNGLQAQDSDLGVVILVEGAEHGLRLAQKLAGWSLLLGPHVDAGSVPKAMRAKLVRPGTRDRSRPVRAIATTDGFRRVDLSDVDVIVRGDGGTDIPLGLTSRALASAMDRKPLILVDFDDRHQPELRRRSRGRREAYLARGWVVDDRGGPTSPFDQFQATRPGRAQ